MSGRQRWTVGVAVIVLLGMGLVVGIAEMSTRAVSVQSRLRRIENDAALSAIPPGATLIEADGNDCPDAPGVGPSFNWRYSYAGDQDAVFSFYDRRLKRDGWDPAAPSASDTGDERSAAEHYSKSYGRWRARATVRFQSRREFGLGVSVDDQPPQGCG
jgi:hypothetical protein